MRDFTDGQLKPVRGSLYLSYMFTFKLQNLKSLNQRTISLELKHK